jgi:hypothetical protein
MKRLFGLLMAFALFSSWFTACGDLFGPDDTKSNLEKARDYDPDDDTGEKKFSSWQFGVSSTITVSYTNKSNRPASYKYNYGDVVTVTGYTSEEGARAVARQTSDNAGRNTALLYVRSRSDYKSGAAAGEPHYLQFRTLWNGTPGEDPPVDDNGDNDDWY